MLLWIGEDTVLSTYLTLNAYVNKIAHCLWKATAMSQFHSHIKQRNGSSYYKAAIKRFKPWLGQQSTQAVHRIAIWWDNNGHGNIKGGSRHDVSSTLGRNDCHTETDKAKWTNYLVGHKAIRSFDCGGFPGKGHSRSTWDHRFFSNFWNIKFLAVCFFSLRICQVLLSNFSRAKWKRSRRVYLVTMPFSRFLVRTKRASTQGADKILLVQDSRPHFRILVSVSTEGWLVFPLNQVFYNMHVMTHFL